MTDGDWNVEFAEDGLVELFACAPSPIGALEAADVEGVVLASAELRAWPAYTLEASSQGLS